jgi:hypothetical protein
MNPRLAEAIAGSAMLASPNRTPTPQPWAGVPCRVGQPPHGYGASAVSRSLRMPSPHLRCEESVHPSRCAYASIKLTAIDTAAEGSGTLAERAAAAGSMEFVKLSSHRS